jgi:endo-1,4-beta-xylanase
MIGLLACVLLALAQIQWSGYQLGVGNQGIQIAFLEKLHNGELFLNDAMVKETLGSYPSFFFHLCARLLALADLPTLYVWLHVAATAGVFAAVAGLSRAMTRNPWAAPVSLLVLLAGHHQALAGELLYSPGFTHTWAVFPLSLLALYLFFRDRYATAFLLVGVAFNFHALEAGHVVLIMGFAAVYDIRRVGIRNLALGAGLFGAAALPTLMLLVRQAQVLEAGQLKLWLELMHIRSADHSFPTAWWQNDQPDIPRFACVLGLAAVSLGFRLPARMKRRTLLLAAGVGLLFVMGTLFTEIWPVSLVIRAQFFRCSRILFVLAVILIAHGGVMALRLPFMKSAMPKWQRWLEFASGVFTLGCLVLPPAIMPLPMALLPVALLAAVVVALISGRLAWQEALVAGLVLLVCVVAYQTIHFVIPGTSWDEIGLLAKFHFERLPGGVAWGLLAVAGLLAAVTLRPIVRPIVGVPAVIGGAVAAIVALALLVPGIQANAEPAPAWADVQRWAAAHTPQEALFVTPTQESNQRLYSFRVYSQRSVVGEWRDGTQLYFNGKFAADWWRVMNDLQPGMVVAASGKSRLNRGQPLDAQDDETVVKLARAYEAKMEAKGPVYIVLRTSDQHYLEKAYSNAEWTIYRPVYSAPAGLSADPALPMENQYLTTTVLPNIEKNRKSDAQVTLVDAAGKPLAGVEVTIVQTGSAFSFGCSLPFFKQPAVDTKADYKPPEVTAAEQAKFLELFNYSVIPFSGQWRFMEPKEGQIGYEDLDLYVDWCVKNGIRPEFRFVAGYQPPWVRGKVSSDVGTYIQKRAKELAARYGTKIMDWQVTSEDVGVQQAKGVFEVLRSSLPKARLGIADDAKFWSVRPGAAGQADRLRGIDTLRDLKKLGVQVDFFALEGKHPLGLWAAGKDMYDTLDAFAKEGVKIHITELGVAVGDRIEGPVRDGKWTSQLQADYYERFLTIAYSHPAVEAVNIMGIGPKTWMEGQGLLDEKYEPTQAFVRVKDLITKRWRTTVNQKTDANGQVAFRGFQGSYQVTVKQADGKTATGVLEVVDVARSGVDSAANNVRLVLDAAAGTLKRVER